MKKLTSDKPGQCTGGIVIVTQSPNGHVFVKLTTINDSKEKEITLTDRVSYVGMDINERAIYTAVPDAGFEVDGLINRPVVGAGINQNLYFTFKAKTQTEPKTDIVDDIFAEGKKAKADWQANVMEKLDAILKAVQK